MLNPETFRESLRSQFEDGIQMAIHECYSDYHNTLNSELLHEKLNTLQRFALKAGFKPREWDELIINLCPESFNECATHEIAA